jgi:membrane protein YqaA with SNARE-associated domain
MKIIAMFLQIYIYSFIATVFFLPVSGLDVYFISTFSLNTIWYILPILLLCEVINAILVYKFTKGISKLAIRKKKAKLKLEKITSKIHKLGFWGIVLVGATPLPYSLVLYSAGAVQWGNVKKFSLAVLIGRSIKYIGIALLVYFSKGLL